MKRDYCRKCNLSDPLYSVIPCPLDGGFGRIGQHVYNIHVTAITYKCQCGSMMGHFNSWCPRDQLDVDPFGSCPVRSEPVLFDKEK